MRPFLCFPGAGQNNRARVSHAAKCLVGFFTNVFPNLIARIDTGDAVQRVLSGEKPGKPGQQPPQQQQQQQRRNSNSNKENNRPSATEKRSNGKGVCVLRCKANKLHSPGFFLTFEFTRPFLTRVHRQQRRQ